MTWEGRLDCPEIMLRGMETFWRLVHLAAAAYWLGGLVTLAIVAVAARRRLDAGMFATVMASAGRSFMWGAVVAGGLLAVSGVALASTHVSSAGDLATSSWGRTLLEKTGLVVLVVALSAVHSVAGARAASRSWRLASRALSPAILAVTLGIFYMGVRLAAA